MPTEKVNIQDSFLNELRKQEKQARILLSNGKEICGLIKGFDQFTVKVGLKDTTELLVYKSAIAIITAEDPAPPTDEETGNNDD